MSLQVRLSDLITAIGADIKALQAAAGKTPDQSNGSITNQASAFASDTYLVGSNVPIPQGKIKVGSRYRCKFNVVKTAAGVAAPIITIRVGTAGAIGDTSRGTLTLAAQTAAIDEGYVEVDVVFRTAGASASFASLAVLGHRLAATGLSTSNNSVIVGLSSANFDITGANLQIGLSVNGGTSASWTVQLVAAQLINLA